MGTESAEQIKTEWVILGLDSSTTNTGIVAAACSASGCRILAMAELKALPEPGDDDNEAALWRRIWEIKYQIAAWMRELPFAVDALAFECPQVVVASWGLRESTRDVYHCIGSYVPLSCFKGLRKIRVGTMTAAALYGGCGKKTEVKKQLCIQWANTLFEASLPELLTEEKDAIADALACVEVARKILQREEWESKNCLPETKKRRKPVVK